MKKRSWLFLLLISGFVLFTTNSCEREDDKPTLVYGSVKDIDGNDYKTIKIGTQNWMAENLNTTRYQNGDLIGTTKPFSLGIGSISTPKFQWAVGEKSDTYGRLYTWHAVTDSRNLCPEGWHVPTDEEWTILEDFLGGEIVAGGKLKEAGLTHWFLLNRHATDETGFTALPAGVRTAWGAFISIGKIGGWWSSTGFFTNDAMARLIAGDKGTLYRGPYSKSLGFAVRCLQDQ